jgi:hypothetical protein
MLPDALGLLLQFGKLLVKLLLSFSHRRLRFAINALRL